ncbi:peptidylprolyl isomerase [Thalassotalea eurytherma]|uniref:Peptidyl-prolyl cis-trans isomerase n=1 Tax=Thalassotalea eurytherma TaxID=1144278 RepID=A0ABQ6H2M1_9GAMM|nr:peptidylprolyl isomerase [Thalassotalea eurytherma]GLX82433.1 peptidyl-prolyl cis-trans isomerase [Thalassotalea eurytherma]
MYKLFLVFCLVVNHAAFAQNAAIDPNNLFPQVKFETSKGVVVVELDRIKAPITVDNFLTYVVTGEYNNTLFHRVIEGFVVQGGGYDVNYVPRKSREDIFNESGNGLKNETYTIAMAKESRPHTANRQFYFNMDDNTNLDPGMSWGYAVFGAVTEGEEVLEEIAKQKTDYSEELGWEDVPVEPVILIKAILLPAR